MNFTSDNCQVCTGCGLFKKNSQQALGNDDFGMRLIIMITMSQRRHIDITRTKEWLRYSPRTKQTATVENALLVMFRI